VYGSVTSAVASEKELAPVHCRWLHRCAVLTHDTSKHVEMMGQRRWLVPGRNSQLSVLSPAAEKWSERLSAPCGTVAETGLKCSSDVWETNKQLPKRLARDGRFRNCFSQFLKQTHLFDEILDFHSDERTVFWDPAPCSPVDEGSKHL
jgi:hypothetical protein